MLLPPVKTLKMLPKAEKGALVIAVGPDVLALPGTEVPTTDEAKQENNRKRPSALTKTRLEILSDRFENARFVHLEEPVHKKTNKIQSNITDG